MSISDIVVRNSKGEPEIHITNGKCKAIISFSPNSVTPNLKETIIDILTKSYEKRLIG